MFAGRLRDRIQIVNPTGAQDTTGGTSLADYTTFAEVWATVEAESGTEQLVAESFTAVARYRIVLRYLAGVTCDQQILFDGRKFQIEAVLPQTSRKRALVLSVVEINDSAQQ